MVLAEECKSCCFVDFFVSMLGWNCPHHVKVDELCEGRINSTHCLNERSSGPTKVSLYGHVS
jgi:hypothetical protein